MKKHLLLLALLLLISGAMLAQEHTISVSANPSDGGSPYIGDTPGTVSYIFQHGKPCTVHANTNLHYIFIKWTEYGGTVSTEEEYTFNVDSDRELIAHFNLQTYTIIATPNPSNGGTVTGNGAYIYGDTCELVATPATGYQFVNWMENGEVVPEAGSIYSFVVTGNRTLTANFEQTLPTQYTITATPNNSDWGTVIGGGQYNAGDTCELVATPAEGYQFVNWTENEEVVPDAGATYSFTVNADRELVANFQQEQPAQYTITATAEPAEGGTVTGGGQYNAGDNCELVATPNEGYQFDCWKKGSEQVSTNQSYSFEVTESATYTAYFSETPVTNYTITVTSNNEDWGMVTGGGTYPADTTISITATANSGYTFTNWTECDTVVTTNTIYTFTVTGNRTLVANFQQVQYSITVMAEPEGWGTVSVDPEEAPQGTNIRITINEFDGFELDTIIVYNINNPQQTIPVNNNEFKLFDYSVIVKARFRQITLEIGTIDPICSGESLDLAGQDIPSWAQSGVWQLSPTDAFDSIQIFNIGQTFDASYDDWFLRYHYQKNILENTIEWNSNAVQIAVNSLEGLVFFGEENVEAYQQVEYRIEIESLNNNDDYSFVWNVSDEQADTTVLEGVCKVAWGTPGSQQVSVIVTDNTTGCTVTLFMDVYVTACIEDLQEIQPKYHTNGNVRYVLLLVYPNPNNEEYQYQWLCSNEENGDYTELHGETGQYYYKNGGLDVGYYKVRVSKTDRDGCYVITKPYYVQNENGRLIIYPNPTERGQGIVVKNDGGGMAQFTIVSMDGRTLYTQTIHDSLATIEIDLPSGVYITYLTNSEGYTNVGKLVIQ